MEYGTGDAIVIEGLGGVGKRTAAQRELKEETNLEADFTICGAYHEHVRMEGSDESIEDKLFFICKATNISGEMASEFEGGRNQWLTREAFMQKEKHFASVDSEFKILNSDTWLIEDTITYSPDMF